MDVVWDEWKNKTIKASVGRNGVGFEQIESEILEERVVYYLPSSNPIKYPWQRRLVVIVDGYAYIVPYTVVGDTMKLITVYPSRKYTKILYR